MWDTAFREARSHLLNAIRHSPIAAPIAAPIPACHHRPLAGLNPQDLEPLWLKSIVDGSQAVAPVEPPIGPYRDARFVNPGLAAIAEVTELLNPTNGLTDELSPHREGELGHCDPGPGRLVPSRDFPFRMFLESPHAFSKT